MTQSGAAARAIACLRKLEGVARARGLSLEHDQRRLGAVVHAESVAVLDAAQRMRALTRWPHWLCKRMELRVLAGAALTHLLTSAIERARIESDRASEEQRYWGALRRGLERRAVRRVRR